MIHLKSILTESSLAFDNDFKEMVKQWEGPGPTDAKGNHMAYDDANPRVPAKPGVAIRGTLTIGYGTTAAVFPNLKPGMTISKADAERLLAKGIADNESKAARLIPKFTSYPKYVRTAILNAIYRGDLGPVTRKLINQGKWDRVATEYLNHPNYTNPGRFKGVVKRMKSNADAFAQYAAELKGKKPTASKTTSPKKDPTAGSIVGKMLYPRKRTSADYVNVRTSPEVNTGLLHNFQTKITWPEPVGKVLRTFKDTEGRTWYQVKLLPGVGNRTGIGYVRYDNVTTDKNAKYI
jgi:GH24 family phage-related lysozyme (muramidase)